MAKSSKSQRSKNTKAIIVSVPSIFERDETKTKVLVQHCNVLKTLIIEQDIKLKPFDIITFQIQDQFALCYRTSLTNSGISAKTAKKIGEDPTLDIKIPKTLKIIKDDSVFKFMESKKVKKMQNENILVYIKKDTKEASLKQDSWGCSFKVFIKTLDNNINTNNNERNKQHNSDSNEYVRVKLSILHSHKKLDFVISNLTEGTWLVYQCTLDQHDKYGFSMISMFRFNFISLDTIL